MKSKLFAALLVAVAPMALPASTQAQGTAVTQASAADAAFARLVADFEAYEREQDPFTAASEGDKEALARLPDLTRAAEVKRADRYAAFKRQLDGISAAQVSADQRLNHAFLGRVLNRRIEAVRHDGSRLAFDSEGGPDTWLGYVAGSTRITSRADADAYLARLEGFPRLFRQQLENARRGLSTGFVQPAP